MFLILQDIVVAVFFLLLFITQVRFYHWNAYRKAMRVKRDNATTVSEIYKIEAQKNKKIIIEAVTAFISVIVMIVIFAVLTLTLWRLPTFFAVYIFLRNIH